jgi:hypothetical protein
MGQRQRRHVRVPAQSMDLSPDARKVMEELRERFVAALFPNPCCWPISMAEVGGAGVLTTHSQDVTDRGRRRGGRKQ